MNRPLVVVPTAHAPSAADLGTWVAALTATVVDGTGPAVVPVGAGPAQGGTAGTAGTAGPPAPDAAEVPDEVALVVPTSGSTGEARHVLLPAAALRASAAATAARLGGPGTWLLALPLTHVAGLQVVVRSVLAGTTPVVVDGAGGFRPDAFARAVAGLPGGRRYTSLVPTQLHRLLDDPAGADALRGFDAVLVGGAATPGPLLDRAREADVAVVRTFGASETCGGCVYDGVPLDGVRVRTDDDGHVLVTGPVLASGYLGRPDLDAPAFPVVDGERWWRSGDLGEVRDGRLRVLGRADDVLVTGGVKVAPAAVERALVELPGVREASVVGLPDDAWGQAVTAVVVVAPGSTAPTLDEVRRHVAERLGAEAAPRTVVVVPSLPLRGPGKIDRRAVAELAAARRTTP